MMMKIAFFFQYLQFWNFLPAFVILSIMKAKENRMNVDWRNNLNNKQIRDRNFIIKKPVEKD